MSSPTEPTITIALPSGDLLADGLAPRLEMARAAAEGTAYEISISRPIEDANDPQGQLLAWLDSQADVKVTFHQHPTDDWAPALNTAIAAATAPIVLVLEPGVSLPPSSVKELLQEWAESDADWLDIPVRVTQGPEETASTSNTKIFSYFSGPSAFLCARDTFMRLRGYDERRDFIRATSVDLRVRFNRAGLSTHVASNTNAYASETAATSGSTFSPEEAQRLVAKDSSIYRNLKRWSVPPALRPPLVSVVIATRDRAKYLPDALRSVLSQTVQEFEIIVVDDGSTDNTAEVVKSFDDSRINYVWQPPAGISAARNRASDIAKGYFTAVHDDDDLMLPNRLEVSITAITEEYDASYGSWINFEDVSGELILHVIRDGFNPDLVAFNGQGPGHSTWLVPTEMMKTVRYDESYSASVDHNLAVRLSWSGCRWVHTGHVSYLRRIHPSQVSATDGNRQKIGHVLTRFANEFGASRSDRSAMRAAGKKHRHPSIRGKESLFPSYGAWLPDHLVDRMIVFKGNVSNKIMKLGRYSSVYMMLTERDLSTGRLLAEKGYISGVSWDDLVVLRAKGEFDFEILARPLQSCDTSLPRHSLDTLLHQHIDKVLKSFPAKEEPHWAVIFGDAPPEELRHFASADRRSRLVATTGSDRKVVNIFGFRGSNLPRNGHCVTEMMAAGKLLLVDPFQTDPASLAHSTSRLVRGA